MGQVYSDIFIDVYIFIESYLQPGICGIKQDTDFFVTQPNLHWSATGQDFRTHNILAI